MQGCEIIITNHLSIKHFYLFIIDILVMKFTSSGYKYLEFVSESIQRQGKT